MAGYLLFGQQLLQGPKRYYKNILKNSHHNILCLVSHSRDRCLLVQSLSSFGSVLHVTGLSFGFPLRSLSSRVQGERNQLYLIVSSSLSVWNGMHRLLYLQVRMLVAFNFLYYYFPNMLLEKEKQMLIPMHHLLQFVGIAVFFHSIRCPEGFQGVGCKTPFCRTGCYNGGTCVKPNVCKCLEGFEGPACLSPVCRPPCRYGGECIGPDKCRCPQGFIGPRCEKKRCLVSCLNDGRCIGPYVCHCMPGYSGQRCEIGKSGVR